MDSHADAVKTLARLIKDVKIAMLTTVSPEGKLISRPLGTQEVAFDGDLWFIIHAGSAKVAEIAANPHVCVAYADISGNTYVSVSGRASVIDDRQRVEKYWSPVMKPFFPQGKDDPEIRLLRVEVDSAEYWDGPGTLVGKALYLAVAALKKDPTVMSHHDTVDLSRRH
ncbi:pyridoxamine 5'-phosphate oxidase family protein [Tahibacter amnicola]|uniref:Pyridoxamine 5'-phosphate oxidase family protein n=1 Tax=Tahibacter amnicola TaxID=2976241 RepID=A0ABY6BGQ6_9GAMM|nr:pyridoxamine 5'-phosphate oxidase family protein [Tahibacter amnicola]UXI67047.1 pyridoxamine 5'-phosphate oxidase family protein [Tahibacter amnicola]